MDAAIYVHWAFCPYLCPYCDFAKWLWNETDAERYAAALDAELDAAPPLHATTVFFGGGTPNAYPAAALTGILQRIRERFGLPENAEVTTEMNPDAGSSADLAALRSGGFNRLSIGVQSFVDSELRALGRRHSRADVVACVHAARAAGFTNLNVDLMFGVPHQTLATWGESLGAAIDLDVEHVSTYGLTVEAGTPYERWFEREPVAFPDDDRSADLYALAIDRLTAAGYEQYEISNFARPGFRCEHNANYWRNGSYLGIGVGAASYLGGVRATHTRDREIYETAAFAGVAIPGDSEALVGAARIGEALMLALRTSEGVDTEHFRERYGVDVLTHYDRVIAEFAQAGLLDARDGNVRLTVRGRFVANDVCGAFLA